MIGLLFTPTMAPWGPPPIGQQVFVQGTVAFEDCRFEAWSGSTLGEGAVDVLGGVVAFHRCNLTSWSHNAALRVVAGVCTITDTVLTGPSQSITTNPCCWQTTQNVALLNQGGVVIASRITAHGGHSLCGLCSGSGAAGIEVAAGASMFLTDSTVRGGSPASNGLLGHAGVWLARNTILAGSGSPTPVVGAVVVPELLGLGAAVAPLLGQTFSVTAMSSAPAAILAFFCAFDWTASALPPFPEPWLLPTGQAITIALYAPAPSNTVVYGLAVPNAAPLAGVQLWMQAAQFGNGTLHASPLVGGTIR